MTTVKTHIRTNRILFPAQVGCQEKFSRPEHVSGLGTFSKEILYKN
jgi:hypothetical protein